MPRHKYGEKPLSTEVKPDTPENHLQSHSPGMANYIPPAPSRFDPTENIPPTEESPEPSPPSLIPDRPIKQQSRAIQARWAAQEAVESELREFFLATPLEKALALLAKMRENCTTAGTILNSRINAPGDQHCETCKMTYEDLKKRGKPDWWLNRPYYDKEDRNIIHVAHFCSASCVSMENNKTQGVKGIADRGMLASDNPKNHPRLTHSSQTELTKQ